jgi:hypothetical protein
MSGRHAYTYRSGLFAQPVVLVGIHLLADGRWEARCEACEWVSGPREARGDASKARTFHIARGPHVGERVDRWRRRQA